MPSRTLIRPGDVIAAARRVPAARPAVGGRIDAVAAFATRDRITSGWDDAGALPWLEQRGIAIAGEVTLDRLWHAVPSFPTVSEVWLRLLEAYGL